MKKTVIIFSLLVAGTILFPSCNKNLKDDIKKLKGQVDELKKDNQELQDQINGIDSILGSNEPISVMTTYIDDNGATRTVSGIYKFKTANAYTQWMIDNGDGTYDISIGRFGDVLAQEIVMATFTYNPTTKAVTHKYVEHNWDDLGPYGEYAVYYDSYSPNHPPVIAITVNSLNVVTGDISLNVSASGDAAYTTASQQAPNPGAPVSTTFSFAGKVKIFTTE